MEPQSPDNILKDDHLRLLILGAPKAGKSTIAIASSPSPRYVINSDQGDSLKPPAKELELHPEKGTFSHNLVHSRADMEAALKIAAGLVKDGKVKTVVWDTITGFSDNLAEDCLEQSENASGEADGRKAWPEYHKYLKNVVNRLFKLRCHVVVCAHFMNLNAWDEKGVAKMWRPGQDGIVPLLYGQSRLAIAGLFNDVVFLEKVSGDKRIFVTDVDGVFGPGCRNLKTVKQLPADIGAFMKAAEKEEEK